MQHNGIPFVEKYRPVKFDDIVLEPLNKQILKNIIETGHFPNLLFYGPPGTGKTTTIINLVNSYQEKLNQKNKELMIHLNASDERGIDIIRSQINQFVNSKTMFNHGMKFVILDEVDYMTKNAQQALHYLIQNYSSSVRFCLICNYISRIEEGLQNEFLKMRFNQLPKNDIISFLNNISEKEGLNMPEKSIRLIQNLYGSDMRSMINFMQSNQNIIDSNINIIDNSVWELLYTSLINNNNISVQDNHIQKISIEYNIDKKNIIKDFLNYIIRNKPDIIRRDFLEFIENIMHNQEFKNSHYINYALSRLKLFVSKVSLKVS